MFGTIKSEIPTDPEMDILAEEIRKLTISTIDDQIDEITTEFCKLKISSLDDRIDELAKKMNGLFIS